MISTAIEEKFQNEYEREIIVMLLGSSNLGKKQHILNHLCEGMFTNDLYRSFYNAVLATLNDSLDITIDNVCQNIKKEQGKALAIELSKECITISNCNYYLTKLLESFEKRLIAKANSIKDFEEIKKIKAKYTIQMNVTPLCSNASNLIVDYYDRWETALKTGYASIDEKIGSFQGGDYIILAGATGMGKTCMMLNLLMRMAKQGKRACVFSLEMNLQQLQNRIICSCTGIPAHKMRGFTMSGKEVEKYLAYADSDEFKSFQIEVSTTFDISIEQIKAVVQQTEADVVFIDYLGLIQGDLKKNSYERLGDISRQLKLLALETNKPFIVLHQLNRATADRQDKRPQISDLRDSGKIEQDADYICFVYRPAYYETSASKEDIDFMIAKNRHGQGRIRIPLIYDEKTQTISDKKDTNKEVHNVF